MSTVPQIFELLLSRKDVGVAIRCSPQQAEVLRVALVKKFTNYKQVMEALGYLSPELAPNSLSMERVEGSEDAVKFFLRVKKNRAVEYDVLPIEEPGV